MEYDPTRMCEMLVGLGDVEVLGIDDKEGAPLRVRIRRRVPRPPCGGCAQRLWSDGERAMLRCSSGRPAASMRQPTRVSLCESIPITSIALTFLLGVDRWQNGPVVRNHALMSSRLRRLYQATSPGRHTGEEALTPKATINLTGQCTSEPSPPVLPPHSQTRMAQAPVALREAGLWGGHCH